MGEENSHNLNQTMGVSHTTSPTFDVSLPIEEEASISLPIERETDSTPKKEHLFKKGNKGGPGRPKGSKNKAILLREQLEEMKWSPLLDLHKFMRKEYWSQTDQQKVKVLAQLAVASTPREKINENHNTDDKTLTIQLAYQPMSEVELFAAKQRFGMIDAQVVECQSADREEDETDDA